MTRRSFATVGVTAAICAAALSTLRAQSPTAQVYPDPASGISAAPIVIVVLADHFTSGQQSTFDTAATNLFKYGLMADPDYAPYADAFRVVTVFEPWTPSSQTPTSKYGFEVSSGSTNCSIKWPSGVEGTLLDAVATADPAFGVGDPAGTVVIGNYGYVFGCSENNWSYVTAGSVGQDVLQHEFGHLLSKLYDEYASAAHSSQSFPTSLDDKNCSTVATPHWMSEGLTSAPGKIEECKLYGQAIFHPYQTCRMGPVSARFCELCAREMASAVSYYRNPERWNPGVRSPQVPNPETENPEVRSPKPPPTPSSHTGQRPPRPPSTALSDFRISTAGFFVQPPQRPSPSQPPSPAQPPSPLVRLLITFNPSPPTATVTKGVNGSGRVVPSYRRLGTYVYEVSEAGKTLVVGVIPDDAYETRDYRGGVQHHGVAPKQTANIIVPIPNETIARLVDPARAVQINFYRLSNVTDSAIRPDVLANLKANKQAEPVAQISAAELRKSLQ